MYIEFLKVQRSQESWGRMADVDLAKLGRLLLSCVIICAAAVRPGQSLANDRRAVSDAFKAAFRPEGGHELRSAIPWGDKDNSGSSESGSVQISIVRPLDTAIVKVDRGARISSDPFSGTFPEATITIGGNSAGAQVVASRMADFVGRPMDIFRPIGMSPVLSLSSLILPSRMPVAALGITSGFGYRVHPILGGVRMHAGVDLAAPYGTPVFATTEGKIGAANWYGGYGLFVAVDHGNIETRYGHMSRLNVVAGQNVHQGDLIGYVGSTGRSTGPHLHYEVRVNGQAVNPLRTKH
jgi:murein DD-endopeptidase MepM/ murein hydrolase activator NlpD